MTPASPSSTATSLHSKQRNLIVGVIVVTLVAWIVTIAALAHGGHPDSPRLRAAAFLLNGPWRFHTGDDLRWAGSGLDDSGWETIDMTAPPGSHDGDVGLPDYVKGWSAHGHSGHTGYAWYRRLVDVPAGGARWYILGPAAVDDGDERYWNGRLLGGSGRLGPHPRVVGVRPLRFALPTDAAGTRGVLAVRAFMLPRPQPSTEGGGMRTAPILAPRPVSDELHSAHWARTIAGYIVDAIEPVAMFLLVGLALWLRPRSDHKGFLVLVSIAVALTALRRLNNATVAWTDLMDLRTYSWMAKFMWAPTVAAWGLAWNRWGSRPWRALDVASVVLPLAGIIATVMHWAAMTTYIRYGCVLLFAVIGARIVRNGPMRILAALILLLIVLAFFGGELLDPLHIPGIWFPFGIGVSRTQYLYAITYPLLAILMVRTLTPTERDAPLRPERV